MTAVLAWLRAWWASVIVGAALAAVAGVTGRISYVHIEELSVALHQPAGVARIMPFGVDGLVLVGSVVLLQSAPGQWWLGWLGVGPGVAASLFANVESGIRYGWLSAAWAGVPSAGFALACFIAERWLYAQASRGASTVGTPGGPILPEVPTDSEVAAMLALRASMWAGNALSGRQLEARFGLSRQQVTKVRELVGAEANGHQP